MTRPRLLDLFCGAGGAAMGYHRAGFDVVGVDIAPMPRYPFAFVQADALDYLDACWHEYDAIHASPPCQDHSPLSALVGRHDTGWLLGATRALLRDIGRRPWIIENVASAPVRADVLLCGSMFGLRTYRHRRFELSPDLLLAVYSPQHPRHRVLTSTKNRRACWNAGLNISVTGDIGSTIGGLALGIDWMTGNELSQAIPPAYTQFIGEQLRAHLESVAA